MSIHNEAIQDEISRTAIAQNGRFDITYICPNAKLSLRALQGAMDEIDHTIENLVVRRGRLQREMSSFLRHHLELVGQKIDDSMRVVQINWEEDTVDALTKDAADKILKKLESGNAP